ncbi:MAG TPA: hypothetical protein VKA15_06310 [Isosphaeraceae bacterium]|nr:hypothetical protein [Isosphaeraceae bacterium]
MMRTSLLSAVLVVLVSVVALRGDDQTPDGDKTPKSSGASSATGAASRAPASPDQLKGVLRDALKLIQALAEDASKSERELRLPTPGMFAMQLSKEVQTDAVKAIGRAQAAMGDKPGAKTTWQAAVDVAGDVMTIGQPSKRAELYAEIARVQSESGEKSEAQFTLRQALQAARSIKAGSPFSFPVPPGLEFDYDPMAKKSALLKKIAQIQASTGDIAASQDSYRQAVETAQSLEQPTMKVRALVAIAEDGPSAAARPVWNTALESALAINDEYSRSRAVEMVLRGQIKASLPSDAVATVADRLKGDFQNYGLWIVADAIAASDQAVPPQTMEGLRQLAMKAQFDRPSKKIKVFERIAEAQARLGDHEGAYRTAGEPHPLNNVQDFRATQARVNVMKSIAEAQIKAKQLARAKDTISAALEMFGLLPDEDAEAYFPLCALGDLQAKAGDLAGAERTANALTLSNSKVQILAEVAVAHAQNGRRDDAKKVIQRAAQEARRAPNDALWASSGQPQGFDQAFDPMAPVLQTIASAQGRIGDLDGAFQTIAQMGSSAIGILTRKTTVEQIVSTRLDAGDVPGALRAAELIPDSDTMYLDEKAGLLERIAKHQSEKSDPAIVLEWATKQRVPNTSLQLLRGLADGIAARYAPKQREENPANPAEKPESTKR